MRHFRVSALFFALFSAGIAQAPKTDDGMASARAGNASGPASRVKSRASDLSPDNFSQWEYWTNVTIPARGFVNLDSQLDFSTTSAVRMTIRTAEADMPNVVLNAYWAIPQVPYFGIADVIEGRRFPYSNAGGATLNPYGSQFRLQVVNNGPNPITVTQVLLFMRAR